MNKNKFLLATAGLMLFAAGCDAGEETDNSSGETEGTEGTGETEGTDEQRELVVWDWTGPYESDNSGPVEKVIAQFEDENPNVTLNIESIMNSEMRTQLMAAASADNLPDVAYIDGLTMTEFIETGMITDLTNFTDDWDGLEDYPESVIDAVVDSDGNVYGVPGDGDVRTLLYRTDVFEAAGLDPNSPPETWSELVEYSQAIQEVSDETGVEWGFALNGGDSEHTTSRSLPWIWDLGGDLAEEDGTPLLNSEPVVETVAFMNDLVNEYNVSPPESYLNTKQEVASLINSGNAAMAIVGSWEWNSDSNYLLQDNLEGNLAAAPIPMPDNSTVDDPYTMVGHGVWVVFESSEVKDDAWKWIETRNSVDYLVDNFSNGTGNLPLRVSAYDDEAFAENPIYESFIEAVPYARSRIGVSNFAEISQEYRTAAQSVLSGESNPQDALDQAQDAAN